VPELLHSLAFNFSSDFSCFEISLGWFEQLHFAPVCSFLVTIYILCFFAWLLQLHLQMV